MSMFQAVAAAAAKNCYVSVLFLFFHAQDPKTLNI